jgi:RNA polymerase sigma factor (sigma-70 family)
MIKDAESTLIPDFATRSQPPNRPSRVETADKSRTHNLSRDAGILVPRTWDQTVRTHQASIYRLAYRLTGNPHDAEDLTQDVFVKVLQCPSTFSPSVSGNRLYRVTKALYRDQILRHHGIRHGFLGEDAEDRMAQAEDPHTRVAQQHRDGRQESVIETVE